MQIKILFALPALILMTAAASANCVSLPDGPQSRNVENGERRMLCLNNELAAKGRQIEFETRFNTLSTQVQRIELQNRFARLPTVSRF